MRAGELLRKYSIAILFECHYAFFLCVVECSQLRGVYMQQQRMNRCYAVIARVRRDDMSALAVMPYFRFS